MNNIAIDIIGFEKNADETTRRGVVADNVVLDASNYWPYCTRGNCTYPAGDESSDGIYVDGGADMVIEYNVVGRADHGIVLQSENGQLVRNVEVRYDVVFRCREVPCEARGLLEAFDRDLATGDARAIGANQQSFFGAGIS